MIFELNGERWFVPVTDQNALKDVERRRRRPAR